MARRMTVTDGSSRREAEVIGVIWQHNSPRGYWLTYYRYQDQIHLKPLLYNHDSQIARSWSEIFTQNILVDDKFVEKYPATYQFKTTLAKLDALVTEAMEQGKAPYERGDSAFFDWLEEQGIPVTMVLSGRKVGVVD